MSPVTIRAIEKPSTLFKKHIDKANKQTTFLDMRARR